MSSESAKHDETILVQASGFISGPDAAINLGDMAQQLRAIAMLRDLFPDHPVITLANSVGDRALPISAGLDRSLTSYLGKTPTGAVGASITGFKVMSLIINAAIHRIFGASLLRRSGRRVLKGLDACQFVFFAGSGTLNERYARGVAGLWLLNILLARILGKPIVLIGQQIGPLEGKSVQIIFGWILSLTDYLGCRDQESVAVASAIGLAVGRVAYSGDEGGYLPPTEYQEGRALLDSVGIKPGFVAMHFRLDGNCPFEPWIERYAALTDAIAQALERQVLLVPMGYRGAHDDREALRKLTASMRSSCVLLQCESPQLTKSCLAHASLAIGVANHFVVFAASVGVPCIGLHASKYMRQKLDGAAERFGLVRSYPIARIQSEDCLSEAVQLAKPISHCEIPDPFDPELPEDYWDWLKVLKEAGVDAPQGISQLTTNR